MSELDQDQPTAPTATEFQRRRRLLNHLDGYGRGIVSAVSASLESGEGSPEAEPSAFHRAFRRWHGTTPHEFRAALT